MEIITRASGGAVAMVGLPLSFDGIRPAVRFGAHATGAHNDELDAVLGGGTREVERR